MSCIASNLESLVTAHDLPARLASALAGADRPCRGGRRFAHELSYGRHFGPAPATARPAAVIVLLFRRGPRWHIPLTPRPSALLRHGGQISLPGGVVELDESSADAAVRELAEELGTDARCDIIKQLPDCYVYASDFLVTPWLAATTNEMKWLPRTGEVERVLELPLEVLLDSKYISSMTIERGPLTFRAPCIQFGEDRIWGATAIILDQIAGLLQAAASNIA
ncbi:MAG TPA: CoA pyrophosphatase [Lacipirellulaceae bacterium]|jgi:8-oxo-dGTP pyrophosphatase MutT (NUDIX family)